MAGPCISGALPFDSSWLCLYTALGKRRSSEAPIQPLAGISRPPRTLSCEVGRSARTGAASDFGGMADKPRDHVEHCYAQPDPANPMQEASRVGHPTEECLRPTRCQI